MRLILIALKYCKKFICTLLIIAMCFSTNCFANINEYKIEENVKIELLNKAKIVTWDKFDGILAMKSRFVVIDYYTNTYFTCTRYMGGYHADIETVDKEATKALKSIHKDRENWKHRPVLIITEDGNVYCASSFVVPHCGRDNEPYLKKINNRSNGYGYGENYDRVKGNDMDGHICIHVRKCRNHYDGKESKKHQDNLDFLEKEKNKIK